MQTNIHIKIQWHPYSYRDTLAIYFFSTYRYIMTYIFIKILLEIKFAYRLKYYEKVNKYT